MYICSEHKTLTKEMQRIGSKLKTALLQKHKFEIKYTNPDEKLSVKEKTRKTKIFGAVSQLNALLLGLEQKRNETTKHVSKIDELIDLGYNKLDTNTKDFMDAIKMLARNMFYLSFQSFKEKYNNYRDDHVLFRHLTRSSGNLSTTANGIKIEINPQMEYQPKIKKIIFQVLNEVNKKNPKIPDGTKRKIELILKN